MLVLTRKQNQKVRLNDDIEITVLRINRGQVRLGIAAPDGVRVHRQEVYEAIRKEDETDE